MDPAIDETNAFRPQAQRDNAHTGEAYIRPPPVGAENKPVLAVVWVAFEGMAAQFWFGQVIKKRE